VLKTQICVTRPQCVNSNWDNELRLCNFILGAPCIHVYLQLIYQQIFHLNTYSSMTSINLLHVSALGYHAQGISYNKGIQILFCSPYSISIQLCNKNQLNSIFILSLFRQSASACFGHICSPSSGGVLYIYNNLYVLCFLVDRLLAGTIEVPLSYRFCGCFKQLQNLYDKYKMLCVQS